jgi:hypothetical protein
MQDCWLSGTFLLNSSQLLDTGVSTFTSADFILVMFPTLKYNREEYEIQVRISESKISLNIPYKNLPL